MSGLKARNKKLMKFDVLESDRRIWRDELTDFVPARIFDAHSHMYDTRFAPAAVAAAGRKPGHYPKLTFNDLQRTSAALFPGRKVHYLTCGFPWHGIDIDGMNEFVASEAKHDSLSFSLMLANPGFSAKDIERRLETGGFMGFKPYMCFSKSKIQEQSTLLQMLPEPYWRIANERKLVILLHLGRYRSIADPVNQRQIRTLAERYQGVRLQLAHCARCFTPEIAEKGLSSVADLPNVHLDTSSVCETEVFHILFDIWPRRRILFGTDNPVGVTRGKIASFGLGWFTVNEGNTKALSGPHVPYRPTFLAYENLRAIRYAARRKKWGRRERDDFFWNNAAGILRLNPAMAS